MSSESGAPRSSSTAPNDITQRSASQYFKSDHSTRRSPFSRSTRANGISANPKNRRTAGTFRVRSTLGSADMSRVNAIAACRRQTSTIQARATSPARSAVPPSNERSVDRFRPDNGCGRCRCALVDVPGDLHRYGLRDEQRRQSGNDHDTTRGSPPYRDQRSGRQHRHRRQVGHGQQVGAEHAK